MWYEQSVARYIEIKKLRESNMTFRAIGKLFEVSGQAISIRFHKGFPKQHGSFKHGIKLTGRDLVREQVRKRDNYTCQKCGKEWKVGMRRFDVHHLEGKCGKKSRGYDSIKDIETLITYCHKCHLSLSEVRHKMRKAYKNNPI